MNIINSSSDCYLNAQLLPVGAFSYPYAGLCQFTFGSGGTNVILSCGSGDTVQISEGYVQDLPGPDFMSLWSTGFCSVVGVLSVLCVVRMCSRWFSSRGGARADL